MLIDNRRDFVRRRIAELKPRPVRTIDHQFMDAVRDAEAEGWRLTWPTFGIGAGLFVLLAVLCIAAIILGGM